MWSVPKPSQALTWILMRYLVICPEPEIPENPLPIFVFDKVFQCYQTYLGISSICKRQSVSLQAWPVNQKDKPVRLGYELLSKKGEPVHFRIEPVHQKA